MSARPRGPARRLYRRRHWMYWALILIGFGLQLLGQFSTMIAAGGVVPLTRQHLGILLVVLNGWAKRYGIDFVARALAHLEPAGSPAIAGEGERRPFKAPPARPV